MHSFGDDIQELKTILDENPGKVLCTWTANSKHGNPLMHLVGRTGFNCLYANNGKYMFFRFIGAQADDKIIYSGNKVRVTTGKRAGFVLPPEDIKINEETEPVGIIKELKEDVRSPRYFNTSRQGDRKVIEGLRCSIDAGIEHAYMPNRPDLYLATNTPENLALRLNTNTIGVLRRLPEYDNDLSPHDNFYRLQNVIGIEVQKGRTAFPYYLCKGRGLVLAKVPNQRAVLVPLENLDIKSDYIEIQLSEYIRKMTCN